MRKNVGSSEMGTTTQKFLNVVKKKKKTLKMIIDDFKIPNISSSV